MKITDEMLLFYGSSEWPSNWNRRGFVVKNIHFRHGEQWMMYCKACHFGDAETGKKILAAKDPKTCKDLGREVTPFDEDDWNLHAPRYVRRGCLEKARQHEDVTRFLMESGKRLIVEASQSDVLWGVGLGENDPRILDPSKWRGKNWLGKAWMEARDIRSAELGISLA